MPLILPGNVASATAATGYDVDNSCRFNFGDDPKLSKSVSSGSGSTKFTFSCWFKTTTVNSSYGRILWNGDSGGSYETGITMYADGRLSVAWNNGSDGGRTWLTNAKYLDPAAWYHLVVRYDSTDGTAGDRLQIWINGVRNTSFSSSTNPGSNEVINVFKADVLSIGREVTSADRFSFDGYLAEVCVIDNTAYTATDFGEFDDDSPTIWKPIDVSGLTFGTNGFYLDFKASGNLGNDANGGTDLDESNIAATDQSTDTPTLNYATLNPLVCGSYATLSEGNLKLTGNTSSDSGTCYATIAFPENGKWYIEEKMTDVDSGGQFPESGIQNDAETSNFQTNLNSSVGMPYKTNGSSVNCSGNIMLDGSSAHSISTVSDGAIKQFAIDMDNGAVYYGLNNTWYNSGDPTSGASRTGAIDTWTAGTRLNTWYGTSGYNGSDSETNFGSPTYANSSDAADADGSGQFEYAPPSGYFALNSKNLAEYG